MNQRAKFILVLFVMLTSSWPAFGTEQPSDQKEGAVPVYTTEPVSTEAAASWREDLRSLVHQLEQIHPEPYHTIDEQAFDRAVDRLHESIPRLAEHEILVELARLLAMIGDGHTSLALYFAPGVDFHILPYRLGIYEGGIWIEAADGEYEELVGGELLSIGGVPAERALGRVAEIISRDNDNWIDAVAPNLLNRIEVLHALGLSEDLKGTRIEVVRSGERISRFVTPLEQPQKSGMHDISPLPQYTDDWFDARDRSETELPLYQQNRDEIYWWRYLPDLDLLYIQWDKVQNDHGGPTALEMFQTAMEVGRREKPAKSVIDIRNNPGGEGGLLPPIIREIVRTREIDQPGKLFLIIGRRTFSAAQMMTSMLEQISTAILVGEPSSAFYNGYAGHTPAVLPRSGVTFMVSPDYYQMGQYPRDSRRQATPELAAIPTFEDYRTNRDPALDVILDYDPEAEHRLVTDLEAAVTNGDHERAIELVRTWNARPVNRFSGSSSLINRRAYKLLREHETEKAIDLFRLNVTVHPDYANGWDSLGEAYVHAGRTDEAREAFRRALELDPGMASSRAWLEKLDH